MPDPFLGQMGVNPRRIREFYLLGLSGTTTSGWVPFTVPKNASMVYLIVGGGGGGGGAGFTATTGTVKSGGGGGGTGAVSKLLIPAKFLPKTLFCVAGNGGLGGAASGSAGGAGIESCVNDQVNTLGTSASTILISGSAASHGGAAGSSAAAAGGATETVATTNITPYAALGLWTAVAGQVGGASSITANAAQTAFGGTGCPFTGGGGGGGATAANAAFNGGDIKSAGLIPAVPGGAGVAGGPGGPGLNGIVYPGRSSNPAWASTGGSGGGGAATAGSGGIGGGAGGPCSGGGGGGAGVVGAAGGNGGPGFVYIAWW